MNLAGLKITIEKSAVYTFGVLGILLAVLITVVGLVSGERSQRSWLDVLVVAFAGASFHFLAQFIHMIGHALAARAAGYPMSGMLFLYVFAMSQYPADEPALPDRIHIQRSLGGVVAFGLLLFLVLAWWIGARSAPEWTVRYLTNILLVDVALLFLTSALMTDGVLFIVRKEWRSRPSEDTPPA